MIFLRINHYMVMAYVEYCAYLACSVLKWYQEKSYVLLHAQEYQWVIASILGQGNNIQSNLRYSLIFLKFAKYKIYIRKKLL